MFASGSAIVSALFLLQAEAQFEAGARLETRAGESPTGTRSDAQGNLSTTGQAQVVVTAVPLIGVRWLDANDDLRVNSATRILWRPVPLFGDRPIFLESIEASHIRRTSKRSQWRLSLMGSYGEQDYTSLQKELPGQPALPLSATMLTLNATALTSWRSSRRLELTMQLGGTYRRSFNDQTTGIGTTSGYGGMPTQATVITTPGLSYRLNQRSKFEAAATVADTDSQLPATGTVATGHLNVLMIQPRIGIREQLTRKHELHLAVGVSQIVALRKPADLDLPWYPAPILQIDLNSLLQQTRRAVVSSSLGAGTSAFVDPVLGTAVSRATAQASVDVRWGPWNAGARCLFTTELSAQNSATEVTPPDQTSVSVEIPFRYRSSRQLTMEFGGRYSERAPYLGTKNFAWHNREMWLFLNITTTATPSSTRS